MLTQSQIQALSSGIDSALGQIEQGLALKVYAEDLPVVGSQLSAAFAQGQQALKQLTALKGDLVSALSTLTDPAGYAESVVAQKLNDALGAASGFLGSSVTAQANGTDISFSLDTSKTMDFSTSVASDLGYSGLHISTTGTVEASLGYAIHLGFGVDDTGFYVNTGNSPEISLDLHAGAPDLAAGLDFGFLHFKAADQGSSFDGNISVDLSDADGKLRPGEYTNSDLSATISGNAHLALGLTGDLGTAVLPHVSANLTGDWSFSGSVIDPNDDNSNFGSAPVIGLHDVSYDLGSFMDDYVTPLLQKLEPILQPIQKVLAVIDTDLTFLKNFPDWQHKLDVTGATDSDGNEIGDGKITLLDFVKLAKPETDLTSTEKFISLAQHIVDWAAFLAGKDFGPHSYDLGSFVVTDDIRNATFNLAAAATNFSPSGSDLGSIISGLSGGAFDQVDSASGMSGQQIISSLFSDSAFSFPAFTDPDQMKGLLFGGTSNLFALTLPELKFGFGSIAADGTPITKLPIAQIPIIPGVEVDLLGAAQAQLDLAFGFDTRGLQQYATSHDPSKILNGFYISDQITGGVDKPEATLSAAVELAVKASLYLASLGGGGNIGGQLFLNLHDDTPADGKIYFDEFQQELQTNPFTLFDASGRVTAGFSAYVNVLGYDVWRYNSPRLTLASFTTSHDNLGSGGVTLPPPGLGTMSGTTLLVNVGDRAHFRTVSDTTDGDETVAISGTPAHVTLDAFGRSQDFANVHAITANGGAGSDDIELDPTLAVAATLGGGAGQDFLYGGAAIDHISGGDDRDYIQGRAGNDVLAGENGDDVIEGGAGADQIDGGAGFDIATFENSTAAITLNLTTGAGTGDAAGDVFTNIEVYEGSNAAAGDTLTGAAGNDKFFGLDGNDTLNGLAGNDILVGGAGADVLNGGAGFDSASYISAMQRSPPRSPAADRWAMPPATAMSRSSGSKDRPSTTR